MEQKFLRSFGGNHLFRTTEFLITYGSIFLLKPNTEFDINAIIDKSMLDFGHLCTDRSNDMSKPNVEIENMRPYHSTQMRIRR